MTVPDGVDATIEHDEDDGGDTLMVTVGITDPDGVSWNASGHVQPPVTDDDLAALIVKAACGAAAMRSSGVWMALQRRLNLEVDQ